MKKYAKWFKAFFFTALVFFSAQGLLFASNNFSKDAPALKLPPLEAPSQEIIPGERLVYDVFWMGIPVGAGQLWIKEKVTLEGRESFHVVAIAETNEFLSKIYPVHDEVHSWIDSRTMESLRFEKKVSEGKYRAHEVVRYDSSLKKGHYESLKNGTKKDFDIQVPVQDILSAFYWVRRQPLSLDKPLKTIVNSDEKDWDLKIDLLGRELKEMRGRGEVDVILIEPKTSLKGVLEKRGRVWIHLRNDARRAPLLITLHTPFGRIVGVLRSQG